MVQNYHNQLVFVATDGCHLAVICREGFEFNSYFCLSPVHLPIKLNLAQVKNNLQLLYPMALLSILCYACSPADQPLSIDAGVSWELAQDRKANLSEIKYALQVQVPKSREAKLVGNETISVQLKEVKQPLVVDFKVSAEHLHDLQIDGQEVDYIFENGHIIIPTKYLNVGQNDIHLSFDLGDQSLNRQDEFLYTLLVPDRASTAFPCFDQPNLKARYKLTLTVPQAWEALANGALESELQEDSTKTLVYAETKPLPSYLFDFVVGNFETITWELGDQTMTMLHRETDTAKVQRNVAEIFDLHLGALNWLENYTGIAMPFQKFDFALIPSFQYGGMEHPGAITYKASSLFLDESATQNQELGRASLIAHETAHMWFGNLVTMNWFDDVWMKEVFANFMAAKIVNPAFPDIDHDLRFVLAHYPSAYGVDRTAGAHPIQQKLTNLKDAGTLYGSIIYQKAPIVMRMLERKIGEEAMQHGLQEYLQQFSYGNATWDDLIVILDRQTSDDLEDWDRQWIKQSGMPQMQISQMPQVEENPAMVELVQLNVENGKRWSQQLSLEMFADQERKQMNFDFNQTKMAIEQSLDAPNAQFVIPNAAGYGYGYFELDEQSKSYLLKHIHQLEAPMHRGVSWLNLWENMLHHQLLPETLMPTLLEGISTETDPLIRQRLLSYLNSLYWKFLPSTKRQSFTEEVEDVLWTALQQAPDKRQKTAFFNSYRSVAESDDGLQLLYNIWNKTEAITGLTLSENDYTDLALQLAVRGFSNSEDILNQQLDRITNADRKARIQFIIPALSAEESIRDQFFASLKQEENRQIESWVQAALGWLHHPLRSEGSVKYITPSLELLEEIQATGDIFFPKRVLDNTFRGHRSAAAVQAVQQFFADRPNYPENLRNKILQASDLTFRASEFRD